MKGVIYFKTPKYRHAHKWQLFNLKVNGYPSNMGNKAYKVVQLTLHNSQMAS